MIAEGAATPEGYFVQAKSDDDAWKKIAGMGKATQVQIIAQGAFATVTIGGGKWSDKIGAGIVGAVLFAPLVALPAIGAIGQKKMVDGIFAFIEEFIKSGGHG